jgi:type IV secretory pathway TraG/TraD family ATPase VirD4
MNRPGDREQAEVPLPWRLDPGAVVLVGLVVGLWVALVLGVGVSGLVAGTGWATVSPINVLPVLAGWLRDPGDPAAAFSHDPRPGPAALTYTLIAVIAAAEIAALVAVWRWRHGRTRRRRESRSGLATRADTGPLTAEVIGEQARRLRPSLAGQGSVDAHEAGAFLGRHEPSGVPVYASHEDSKAVIGPVRMGKTARQAVRDVLRAPGSVVATTTRFDLIELTAEARAERGPVFVFDPEGRTPWPTPLRLNLMAWCRDYTTALRIASAMVAARPVGDTRSAGYFGGNAETVLAAMLHAAALYDLPPGRLRAWVTRRSREPVDLLADHPDCDPDIAHELGDILDSGAQIQDSSGVSAMYRTVGLVLRPLADPQTRAALTPAEGDEPFDLDRFILDGNATLYAVSKGDSTSAAPIINCLISEILHRAELLSQRPRPGAEIPLFGDLRLDPPLRLCLDEVSNTAPLKDLNRRMSDSGALGIEIYIYSQNFSQLRQRWGADAAKEIWDNASARLVLGGLGDPDELERLARLLPEIEVPTTSVAGGSRDAHVTISQRLRRALTADDIRQLRQGEGLLIYRNLPAARITVPGYWEDPDIAPAANASRRSIRQRLGEPPETDTESTTDTATRDDTAGRTDDPFDDVEGGGTL